MAEDDYADLPLIKVVGISASGKSTLVRALRKLGYRARPVSQEHSNVPSLWQEFENPKVLIYLSITLEAQRLRRPDVSWDRPALRAEIARLTHAEGHADLKIDTSGLSADAVQAIALTYLKNEGVRHAAHPLPSLRPTGSALSPLDAENEAEPLAEIEVGEKRKRKKKKRKA